MLDYIRGLGPTKRTECVGPTGNTLWVESDYGLRDFQPVDVPYGAALIFDGGSLEHGTVNNDTHSTRISIDFRFSLKNSKQVDAMVSAV